MRSSAGTHFTGFIYLPGVAGKGLPAAMLVSMLVGAVRAAAEYTADPAELPTNLNQRLVGRAGSVDLEQTADR